jgi:EAL domain-containing protein (putative c-di-GMP-specific phosphodiesterase class I)
MQVVAEGVENTEQRDFLTERGCDLMQGYLYSRPLPAEELAALVKRQQEIPAPDLSHPG